jgi:IS1 family transposase
MGECNDLLISELYAKERAVRVEIFGIQLDEMWSFVQKKTNKAWIWLALNPANRQIIGMHIGNRSKEDAQQLWENIPTFFHEQVGFFSDYWQAYQAVFEPETHFAVGKDSGLTAYIERFNGTMRQRVSRLVRKALSFSKSWDNHVGAIKYFICAYNRERAALKI